jgi:two-component system, OmpR family, phosphate regulon response regulator PhoB
MAGPFRILLVEDEVVIRGLVETLLTTAEVQVECASSGPEAVKRAREAPFDMYLLDIVLPGLDGVSVLRLLRADPANAGKPVYMLSAKQKSADMETAKRAGATGYIAKPFRGVELMDLVARHRDAAKGG